MASRSNFRKIPFGAARLCQDIATLVNNSQGSDVQFKVGGYSAQGFGETIYDESMIVTLYAHSLILRCRSPYFAAKLDEDKDWKESSKCVIYKPDISPPTFQAILQYIYTGDIQTKNSDNIIELITAANEMGLDELAAECKSEFMCTIKYIFSNDSEESTMPRVPVDVAIRTHIIPALNLAKDHSLSHFSQEILTIMLPRMSVITKSPDVHTAFINGISSEALVKIIASDDLAMTERNVWDLALSWSCHRVKLSKTDVEAYLLSNPDGDDEEEEEEEEDESSGETLISGVQLKRLKKIFTPLLPNIRLSLLDLDDYKQMSDILIYFLSRRRFLGINRFFYDSNGMDPFDKPRKKRTQQTVPSNIIVESVTWELLRKNIFETGGISGCHSLEDLKFEHLFKAKRDGFLASTFHQRCDNKGPTLVIIRNTDGHLFGGVNFNHWKSDNTYSSSILNFLFALPDGCHRKDLAIFRVEDQIKTSWNLPNWGPYFGTLCSDLAVADCADTNQTSRNFLPCFYDGEEKSDTTVAGAHSFTVSDYEVFAISK